MVSNYKTRSRSPAICGVRGTNGGLFKKQLYTEDNSPLSCGEKVQLTRITPTYITALALTVRKPEKKILSLFQPHLSRRPTDCEVWLPSN